MRANLGLMLAAACLAYGCVPALSDELPDGVSNSQNPDDVSLTPEESLKRITLPDGFRVTLFGGEPDLRRPIAFDFDDRGRLWVVENYAHPNWKATNKTDRVVIFEDTDHDGRFDRRTVFWDEGRYLSGIAVGHGGVWLGDTPELLFIPDRDQDDKPDSPPEVVLNGFAQETNNILNNFHWGPDGWMYGAIGQNSESRVGKPGTPIESRARIRRGMWRFHPVTHKFEVLARGMVNPWGADFNEHGDLFTVNTVTAHLWHIVPGMICEMRARESVSPYSYASIQSIGDHLHWGGGRWTNSRETTDAHSVAGGGHAHCGAMIYYGDNWPEKYRGTLFTNNLHGNRVNNDIIRPHGSSFVGGHNDDFLFANDAWFRGLSIKYGPDGGVFISDWHDFGECHDSDGSHRTSGRIYKVTYGEIEPFDMDLGNLTDGQLAELHYHKNEWLVRHSRRILHERAVNGEPIAKAVGMLKKQLADESDTVLRLRALWSLYNMDQLAEGHLAELLESSDEHLRRWAVRLIVDQREPSGFVLKKLAVMSVADQSQPVRLQLAIALQKLPVNSRWNIAKGLMGHLEDARDQFLPLMIWYGIEPLVQRNTQRAYELAALSRIPLLRQYIVRRSVDVDAPEMESALGLLNQLESDFEKLDVLTGLADGLNGKQGLSQPANWRKLYTTLSNSPVPEIRSVSVTLATTFGDEEVISSLRATVMDLDAPVEDRDAAFQSLLPIESGLAAEHLHQIVKASPALRSAALKALVFKHTPDTANLLLEMFAELSENEKQEAVAVMATRLDFATSLLDAIDADIVAVADVSAYALQQLRSFTDEELSGRIEGHWSSESAQGKKADEIARYVELMDSDYLATGDAGVGRAVFNRTCAKCHTLFGEGGTIGPDLTGSGRKKADYVITNLVDPTATIDQAYRLTTVITADGRLYTGFVIKQDDAEITLRMPDAEVKLDMQKVDEIVTGNKSLMPEGMLNSFTDEEVRDLLRYLQSDTQVAPAARAD